MSHSIYLLAKELFLLVQDLSYLTRESEESTKRKHIDILDRDAERLEKVVGFVKTIRESQLEIVSEMDAARKELADRLKLGDKDNEPPRKFNSTTRPAKDRKDSTSKPFSIEALVARNRAGS